MWLKCFACFDQCLEGEEVLRWTQKGSIDSNFVGEQRFLTTLIETLLSKVDAGTTGHNGPTECEPTCRAHLLIADWRWGSARVSLHKTMSFHQFQAYFTPVTSITAEDIENTAFQFVSPLYLAVITFRPS